MLGFAGTTWVVDSGLFLAALLLAACSAVGQAVTDIETRGIDPSYPSYPDYKVLRGGGGGRGADTDALRVGFSLLSGSTLPIGETYDYEVTVTNKSTTEVRLPRCIEWSDVVDDHPKELRYKTLEVVLIVGSSETGNT